MIVTTTISSISVKPLCFAVAELVLGISIDARLTING